jgi:hypothetical protein
MNLSGHRPARRHGVVLQAFRAGDQGFVVVGRVEEAAGRVREVSEASGRPDRERH